MIDPMRLIEFGFYRWCPRSEPGVVSSADLHRSRFLVHVLTEQGFTCIDDDLARRAGPDMPAPFPYPEARHAEL